MRVETKHILIIRIILIAWLIGWFIKWIFFDPYLLAHIQKFPVYHDLFPYFFQSKLVVQTCYLLPLIVIPSIVYPTKARLIAASLLLVICSAILLTHIDTYNDATFVTSFWVSLWGLWFCFNIHREDQSFYQQGCVLAQLLVGMVFLGGLVGKLTNEYFTGEAIYKIFLANSYYWPHTWITDTFSLAQVRVISLCLSWVIIASELFLSLTPVLPIRLIFTVGPVLLLGFTLTNTWMILSVVSCLIGLMMAGLCVNSLIKKS